MVNPINVVKRHIVPAYMNAFYSLDPKVYMSFCVDYPGVTISPMVPPTSLREVKIDDVNSSRELVLNLSISAVSNFNMGEEGISVNFRINGNAHTAYIPYASVSMVFCPDSEMLQQPLPLVDLPMKTPHVPVVESSKAAPDDFGLSKRPVGLRLVK